MMLVSMKYVLGMEIAMKLRELFVNIVFSTIVFVTVLVIGVMSKSENFMLNKKENTLTYNDENYNVQKTKQQVYEYRKGYVPFDICSPFSVKDYEHYDEISDETQLEFKKEFNESSVSTE